MKRKLHNYALLVALCVLLSATLPVHASAKMTDGKAYSWYFKSMKNHEQPTFDLDLDELKTLDAYTLGSKDDKVIYLTFDFGYENGNVKKCLDALNKHNVKGAFFILDNVIKNNTDLIKELFDTGHIVANHTMKHHDMTKITDFEAYRAQLEDLDKLCEEKTGHKMTKFYRPPKGEFTKQNLEYNKQLGYKTIFWSLAYLDWDNNNQPDPSISANRLLARTHNGAVILLHPTSATNAAILDNLITQWKAAGYRFGTLDELVE